MQEPSFYIPPYPDVDRPSGNPYGPDGGLVDAFSDTNATIAQQYQAGMIPPYGWMRGDNNTAIPLYTMPGQPSPGEIMAMMQANATVNANAPYLAAIFLILMS